MDRIYLGDPARLESLDIRADSEPQPRETGRDREHNYLRLLCASNNLKPYLEADINAHENWKAEIDEFLSAVDALQA